MNDDRTMNKAIVGTLRKVRECVDRGAVERGVSHLDSVIELLDAFWLEDGIEIQRLAEQAAS